MITWPAIVKHDQEDELIYISSLTDWQADEEMLLYLFSDRDVLIDQTGKVYLLTDVQQSLQCVVEIATATPENVMELVKAHLALEQTCCIEKLPELSIAEAFELLK